MNHSTFDLTGKPVLDRRLTHLSSSHLGSLLFLAIQQVESLNRVFSSDAQRLRSLSERLTTERFHLAVLGQFKRGKSTLLNALLGEELLPSSVLPVTSIPTFLLAGEHLHSRVVFRDGKPSKEFHALRADEMAAFLSHYVTEQANPANGLNVSFVEVFHPSPLLRHGVLIDTPGIGSTFRHNTQSTLNFLPQCDAALFVLSPDPPITETEIEFLKAMQSKVPRLFFILNKADTLIAEDKPVYLEFILKVLAEQAGLGPGSPVLCASARLGLQARQMGDPALWQQSGMESVETQVVGFLVDQKASALREAIALKVRDVLEDVLIRLGIILQSLQIPLSELGQKLETLEQELSRAERERTIVGDLLVGDQSRLEASLEAELERLRQEAQAYMKGIIHDSLSTMKKEQLNLTTLQNTLAATIPEFFEKKLDETTRAFNLRLEAIFRDHQRRANELIETVRRTAADLFNLTYEAATHPESLEARRRPYWVAHEWNSSFSPVQADWFERLLPLTLRRSRLKGSMPKQTELLVRRNVENLRWSILQNMDESFRGFRAHLDEQLDETICSIGQAIELAHRRRHHQSESISDEVARLQTAQTSLKAIREKLSFIRWKG